MKKAKALRPGRPQSQIFNAEYIAAKINAKQIPRFFISRPAEAGLQHGAVPSVRGGALADTCAIRFHHIGERGKTARLWSPLPL